MFDKMKHCQKNPSSLSLTQVLIREFGQLPRSYVWTQGRM